jgi:hypothetical protein
VHLTFSCQRSVTLSRVRANQTARLDTFSLPLYAACSRCIGYTAKTNASIAIAVLLSSHDNESCATCPTTPLSKFHSTQADLIDLHSPRHGVASWSDHRSWQFMQPSACSFVTAQSQEPLQLQGSDTPLMATYIAHGPKPQRQWFPRILKDCARGNRVLKTAISAQVQTPGPALGSIKTTPGATEAFGPSNSEKEQTTRVVRLKALFKFDNRPRVVSRSGTAQAVFGELTG